MKPRSPNKPPLLRATNRAQLLINLILMEMQKGIEEPSQLEDMHWERLFGTKQSVVANLQKLVQALVILPDDMTKKAGAGHAESVPLNTRELQLLSSWAEEPAD